MSPRASVTPLAGGLRGATAAGVARHGRDGRVGPRPGLRARPAPRHRRRPRRRAFDNAAARGRGAPRGATRRALGCGAHGVFFGLALPVVLAGVRVPAALERAADALVALMLLGLGAWHFVRGAAAKPGAPPGAAVARPVMVGVVHGLAVSAGVTVLAATTIGSRPWVIGYLALFGAGTVLGMAALTAALAWPLGRVAGWRRVGASRLARAAALSSAALGCLLLWRRFEGDPQGPGRRQPG